MDKGSEQPRPPAEHRSAIAVWSVLAFIAGLVCLFLVAQRLKPQPIDRGEHPSLGTRLTKFNLHPLTGNSEPVGLADLRGKVTLINYWGTWCPPCLEEFPFLVKLQREFAEHADFQLLSVCCGEEGPDRDLAALRKETETFLQQQGLVAFDTYADPNLESRFGLIEDATLDSFGYPTTVLTDRDGAIQAIWEGLVPGIELGMETVINELLRQ